MKEKIKSVFFFPNGNTACFNERGEQVGELQNSWFLSWVERAEALGYDTSNLSEIKLPSGDVKLLRFKDDEGKTIFNWQRL